MEVDSMHSAIEHQQKYVNIFSLNDWKNVMYLGRSSRKGKGVKPYQVVEMSYSDILDLKKLNF